MPPVININEVAPRDGLQFESTPVSLEAKYKFIHLLADAGVRTIEAGSFVTPKVAQMRNSDMLADILCAEASQGQFPGVTFQFLAASPEYAQAAIEAGVSHNFGELAVVIGATDENCQSNLRMPTVEDAIQKLAKPVIDLAVSQKIPVRAYISVIFEVAPDIAAKLCKRMLDLGAYEVVPSDTTGIGTALQVEDLITTLKAEGVPLHKVCFHFHGEPGDVRLKSHRAAQMGVRDFDGATGGIGGCAFATRKIPNARTEALAGMFEGQCLPTGIDTYKLSVAGRFITGALAGSPGAEFNAPDFFSAPAVQWQHLAGFDDLCVSIDDRGVAYVALNRPERHNAFDDRLIAELTSAFEILGNDPGVKLIRLSGQGPSFCSGADLAYMQRMAGYTKDENIADAKRLGRMLMTIKKCPKGIIGAFHRNVLAGGTGLASLCDYGIAAAGTKFQIGEVNLGLRPSTISPHIINRIGVHNAAVLFTDGKPFFANRARAYGLIDEVALPGRLEAAADAVINRALQAQDPKFALQMMRSALPRVQSHRPYPKIYMPAVNEEQRNHNMIVGLVKRVEPLAADASEAGQLALIDMTAKDIADARAGDLARQKLAAFLAPKAP